MRCLVVVLDGWASQHPDFRNQTKVNLYFLLTSAELSSHACSMMYNVIHLRRHHQIRIQQAKVKHVPYLRCTCIQLRGCVRSIADWVVGPQRTGI